MLQMSAKLLTVRARASSPPDIVKSRFLFQSYGKNVLSMPHGVPERPQKGCWSKISAAERRRNEFTWTAHIVDLTHQSPNLGAATKTGNRKRSFLKLSCTAKIGFILKGNNISNFFCIFEFLPLNSQ